MKNLKGHGNKRSSHNMKDYCGSLFDCLKKSIEICHYNRRSGQNLPGLSAVHNKTNLAEMLVASSFQY